VALTAPGTGMMLNFRRKPGTLSAYSWPTLLLLSDEVCTH
jgi:hypothetical protein